MAVDDFGVDFEIEDKCGEGGEACRADIEDDPEDKGENGMER